MLGNDKCTRTLLSPFTLQKLYTEGKNKQIEQGITCMSIDHRAHRAESVL